MQIQKQPPLDTRAVVLLAPIVDGRKLHAHCRITGGRRKNIFMENTHAFQRKTCAFLSRTKIGVNLQNGYNGHLTSREAGSVGGQMVKKMIEAYEQGLQ